jgi:hypothetical protein
VGRSPRLILAIRRLMPIASQTSDGRPMRTRRNRFGLAGHARLRWRTPRAPAVRRAAVPASVAVREPGRRSGPVPPRITGRGTQSPGSDMPPGAPPSTAYEPGWRAVPEGKDRRGLARGRSSAFRPVAAHGVRHYRSIAMPLMLVGCKIAMRVNCFKEAIPCWAPGTADLYRRNQRSLSIGITDRNASESAIFIDRNQ